MKDHPLILPDESSFVLASGSPRRKDLLTEAGYQFEIKTANIEEIDDPTIPIRELTALNAALKGQPIAQAYPLAVVLSADTLVLLGEQVFGKPAHQKEAEEMLAQLNGKTHQVFTAVCIAQLGSQKKTEFTVATDVTFRDLTREERRAYHEKIEPLDKAGAYAAQDHGNLIIQSIQGSMSNVIGLPMEKVSEVLESQFGIVPDLS